MKAIPILIALLITLFAEAQTFLPRLGLNMTTNSMDTDFTKVKPRTGFSVGAGYTIELNTLLSIQPELYFIQKSFLTDYAGRFSQNIGTDTYFVDVKQKDTYRISYLEIPVLLKINPFRNQFFLTAGPHLAMGLGGKHIFEYHQTSSYQDPLNQSDKGKIKFGEGSSTSKDVYIDHRIDVGFQAGIGTRLFDQLQVEWRYGRGSNLLKDKDSKNNVFQLVVSIPVQVK